MKFIKLFFLLLILTMLVSCINSNNYISNNKDDEELSFSDFFIIKPYVTLSFNDLVEINLRSFDDLPSAGTTDGWVKWDYVGARTKWSSDGKVITEEKGGIGGIYYERQFDEQMLKNYSFKIDMRIPENKDKENPSAMGVVFRSSYTLSRHRWKLLFKETWDRVNDKWESKGITLFYESFGHNTPIASVDDFEWEYDEWYTVEVDVKGDIFSLKINGPRINKQKIELNEISSGEYKYDIEVPISIGQFGPYAENAPGVEYRNIQFKNHDQVIIEGPEIKIVDDGSDIWTTERTYEETMEEVIADFFYPFLDNWESFLDNPAINIEYNGKSYNPDFKIQRPFSGNERIIIERDS
ncbi:family 16 glycoside hydrolase [Natronospora cellulosivora (SeqCode)]